MSLIPASESSPEFSSRRQPRFLKFRSSQSVILVTVCAATFTDGFTYAVLVPVIPVTLRDRYHVNPADLQLWTSALLGIFGAFALLGSPFALTSVALVGWISDGSKSRRPAYTVGLTCLVGGVTTLALTAQLWMLVISRILQGISTAVVYTVGLALIADTVDPKSIGYYMGYALSGMSFGVIVGPIIGSLIFNLAGYMAVITTMGAIVFVDIILRLFMIEKSSARAYERLQEMQGEATEQTRLLSKQEDIIRVGRFQTFALLSHPRIATGIYGVFVHIVILACFDGVLPIFVEKGFGWTALEVSYCFLAIAIPSAALGPIVGKLSDTYGPRWLAFFGCILTGIPMVLLQFVTRNTSEQVWLIYVLLVAIGSALSLIITPLAGDLFHVVESLDSNGDGAAYAQSYGLFTSAMACGTLVGPVLAGFLKEKFGWTVTTWILGIFVASGAIPVYFFTGGSEAPRKNVSY